jgi:hypothetical protein
MQKGTPVFHNNGITYYVKPANLMQKPVLFQPKQSVPDGILLSRNPVIFDKLVYLPVENRHKDGDKWLIETTVYSIDPETQTVKDSLIFGETGSSFSISKIVAGEHLWLIGVKDSLVTIVSTNAELSKKTEHNTGIKAETLLYAAQYQDKLRIVSYYPGTGILLYDLKTDTWQPERKRFLGKSYDNICQENTNLWFFNCEKESVSARVYDLSKFDAPVRNEVINTAVPTDQFGNKPARFVATTSHLYLGFSDLDPQGGYKSRLISYDLNDKSIQSRDREGSQSFDVIEIKGKTHIFAQTLHGDKVTLYMAQLNPDLSEGSAIIDFGLGDLNLVSKITALDDNRVILIGSSLLPTGKKKLIEAEGKQIETDETISQLFYSVHQMQ